MGFCESLFSRETLVGASIHSKEVLECERAAGSMGPLELTVLEVLRWLAVCCLHSGRGVDSLFVLLEWSGVQYPVGCCGWMGLLDRTAILIQEYLRITPRHCDTESL